MSRICTSTLPPEPNQARPLCANDGQPCTRTKSSIDPVANKTAQTSAPSSRPVRSSVQLAPTWDLALLLLGLRLLVEHRDAAGLVDHRAGECTATRPVHELRDVRVRVRARQDEVDVPTERVALAADIAVVARDAVDLDRPQQLRVREAVVTDGELVLLDRVGDQAVRAERIHVLSRGSAVQHRLAEEVEGAAVGVTAVRVDRPGELRARECPPV